MKPSSSAEDMKGRGRGAPQTSSVAVSLHPLVIMNISEHWTRMWAQSADGKPIQVFGAVLGRQVGRHVELINSFEVKCSIGDDGHALVDEEFFRSREAQYREVFPELDFLGWYTTGGDVPTEGDLIVHKQFCRLHDSPIMIKLDPAAANTDKLPLTVFESLVDASDESSMQWHQIPWCLASEEAERIGIEHVAQMSTYASSSKSQLSKQISAQLGAVAMLHSRLKLIHDYLSVVAVQSGELQKNEAIAREISQVCQRLPVIDSKRFIDEYSELCSEVKLTAYVGAVTKICGSLNDLITKMNVISTDRFAFGAACGLRRPPQWAEGAMLSSRYCLLRSCCKRTLQQQGRLLHRSKPADKCLQKKGLFGVDLLREPSGFEELNKVVRQRSFELVEKIIRHGKERKTVELFDDLSNEICCAADLAECTRSLHSRKEFVEAAETSMRDFTELVESLNTNTDLYMALKNSLISEKDSLTDVDRRTLHLFLADFEQSGIHLPDAKREEFVTLSSEIFDAGTQFTIGAERPVKVSFVERKQYGVDRFLTNPYRYLSNPLAISMCRKTRRWAHNTYFKHNDEQEATLVRLISCRHRLAHLTGFESYAHRAQQFSLLTNYDNAHNFLTSIIKSCRPAAERELAVLLDVLSQCETKAELVGEWDLQYLCSIYRQKAYGDTHVLSKYLSFERVLKGFEMLADRLYGIKFIITEPEDGEVWPGDIIKIDVRDSEGVTMGVIYLDIESRSSKNIGDCHFTVRCSKQLSDGSHQTPIVVLSLSLSRDSQSLDRVFLSAHQAENFFHEMGHAMHSMLGTRCPTDMAEIPSNLMEYFFNDLGVLRMIAKDESGQPMSVDEAASLITSRFAFSSLDILQQASIAVYALFDLELHGHNADGIVKGRYTTTDLFSSIWATVFPHVERSSKSAWHHRFTHLVPYGAKYYSYLVARAAASLIWNSRFRDEPFSKENGRVWAKVQSHGGALPSADLLQIALGYWPTSENLADAIRNEANYTCQLSAVNI
uniref:COP9 signalosome complex subunit 6 n=1 Tax=Ascaris lumbricoides TaxID=6252 RepID=A0A9J2PAY9_ASCLU